MGHLIKSLFGKTFVSAFLAHIHLQPLPQPLPIIRLIISSMPGIMTSLRIRLRIGLRIGLEIGLGIVHPNAKEAGHVAFNEVIKTFECLSSAQIFIHICMSIPSPICQTPCPSTCPVPFPAPCSALVLITGPVPSIHGPSPIPIPI